MRYNTFVMQEKCCRKSVAGKMQEKCMQEKLPEVVWKFCIHGGCMYNSQRELTKCEWQSGGYKICQDC